MFPLNSLVCPNKAYPGAALTRSILVRRSGRISLDVALSAASFVLAARLHFGSSIFDHSQALSTLLTNVALLVGVCAVVFAATGLLSRSWRFVSLPDLVILFGGIAITIAAFWILNVLRGGEGVVPHSIPLIAGFIMLTTLGGMRVLYRYLSEGNLPFKLWGLQCPKREQLLVYGATPETDAFLRALQSEARHACQIVGIIDDDPVNRDRHIRGIEVLGGSTDLPWIVDRYVKSADGCARLVLPAARLSTAKSREIAAAAANAGIKTVRLPATAALLRTAAGAAALEPVEVTDPQRVLVIGGAGYIGSILVEKLLKLGQEVSVIDALHFGEQALSPFAGHTNLSVIREDFRNIEVVTRALTGIGSVIHLGGLVGDPACATDPALTIDINVTATKLLGEIAKARGVRRFLFASSCSVYGACDEVVDEDSRFNPQSLYARTKVAAEAALGALNGPEFAVTCLRFATVYGISGRPRFDLVINLLCAKAVRDRVITVLGPDQWRPFVHVEDVANAIIAAFQAPADLVANEAFNVGSDRQNHTLGEMADLIRSQVPQARIISEPNCPDKRNYRVSFRKIHTKLGFEPAWTLERGIAQVVAAVRANDVSPYSVPLYSNVLSLKERGSESFKAFNITGWEDEFMNLDHIESGAPGAGQVSSPSSAELFETAVNVASS